MSWIEEVAVGLVNEAIIGLNANLYVEGEVYLL